MDVTRVRNTSGIRSPFNAPALKRCAKTGKDCASKHVPVSTASYSVFTLKLRQREEGTQLRCQFATN